MERRELCKGDGESVSDFVIPLLNLGILGVAGDTFLLFMLNALLVGVKSEALLLGVSVNALLLGVSTKVDLFIFNLP